MNDNNEPYKYAIIIFYLILETQAKIKSSWYKLLHNSNNEINDDEITSLIDKLKFQCESIIEPDQVFYRARPYKNSETNEIYSNAIWNDLFEDFRINFPKNEKLRISYENVEDVFNYIPIFTEFSKCKSIFYNWIKRHKDEKFWGFCAKESGRNSNASAGRLNTDKEHHLYLAYDIDTAIAEVRPINNQPISIAEVKIKKQLKMFDFTRKFEYGDGTKDGDYFAFYGLAEMCSMPNFNEDNYYKPTQLISKFIKDLGFDGIIYSSALNENGKNVLIYEFDDDKSDDDFLK